MTNELEGINDVYDFNPNLAENICINCDKIILKQDSVEIEVSNDQIKNFEYIIVNGFKFKKE